MPGHGARAGMKHPAAPELQCGEHRALGKAGSWVKFLYLGVTHSETACSGESRGTSSLTLRCWEASLNPSDSSTWSCHSGGPQQVKVSFLLRVGGSQR